MVEKKSVKIDDGKFNKKPQGNKESMLGRDAIYIDIDDDITSVVEKIKKSEKTVVALIPPARAGVLQSVVNLKLLQRAAKVSRKKITLVTSDKALISLASGLSIPVAKSLNTQANVPVSRNDTLDNETVEIDGKDLAIGELAALDGDNVDSAKEVAAVNAIEADDEIRGEEDDLKSNDDKPKKHKASNPNKGNKVPNFNVFRKKLFIFGGLGVFLIGLLIWAIIFAPHGTITITAKTTTQNVNASVSLDPESDTDIDSMTIKPIIKTTSKSESASFTATGKEMVGGAKARGTVSLTNHYTTNFNPDTGEKNDISLPAGTVISASGQQFTTNSSVTVSKGSTNTVEVTAVNLGKAYNISNNSPVKVAGYDQATQIDGAAKGAFSGGEDQTEQTVVQQSDLDSAIESIKNQDDKSKIKKQLNDEFGSGAVIIDESFSVDYAKASSNPSVGSPVGSGTTPTASITITYTLVGVSESEMNPFLDAQINNLDETEGQKIYDNGLKNIKFNDFQSNGKKYSVAITAEGQVGPAIDVEQIKEMSIDKKTGQIQSELQSKFGNNIKDVKVEFSPFWVSKISNKNKLTINFAIDE